MCWEWAWPQVLTEPCLPPLKLVGNHSCQWFSRDCGHFLRRNRRDVSVIQPCLSLNLFWPLQWWLRSGAPCWAPRSDGTGGLESTSCQKRKGQVCGFLTQR